MSNEKFMFRTIEVNDDKWVTVRDVCNYLECSSEGETQEIKEFAESAAKKLRKLYDEKIRLPIKRQIH